MRDYVIRDSFSLKDILLRFEPDFEKTKKDNPSRYLYGYRVKPFENKVSPQECPYYSLVVSGALLTKIINPGEIRSLDEILCGHTEERINDIGPLCGRDGTEYKPLSQCWRAAIELEELVKFMKQKEEMPASPSSNANEDKKREILNKRHLIKNRNEQRQLIFLNWNKLRPGISSLLSSGKYNQLKLPASLETSDETTLVRPSYNVSSQLDVGGLEYQELTSWADQQVLTPLNNLVGDFYRFTARNCPKAPKEHFFGVMS